MEKNTVQSCPSPDKSSEERIERSSPAEVPVEDSLGLEQSTPTMRRIFKPTSSLGNQLTPKRIREGTPPGLEALLSGPLKLTDVDLLTPGQENTVLGKAIQGLGINSPTTPRSSKGARSKETALTPVNRKKRSRQFPLESLFDDDEPGLKKLCPSPADEDDDLHLIDLKPKFFRSQSESGVPRSIKHAMEQKENDPLLIGDCTRQHTLPIIPQGRHPDLKEISAQTLSELLVGKYNVDYTVIDCRYPYEYSGGHVRGAVNLYTESQVYKKYFSEPKRNDSSNREILIFHCEFSVERGPRMCRTFRDWDRNANMSCFPSLFYPEMYVLNRGYKGFFEEQPSHCEPSTYVKMLDDSEQLRTYKTQCKSEVIRTKSKSVPRNLGRSVSIKKLLM